MVGKNWPSKGRTPRWVRGTDRKGFLSGSNLPQGWGFQSIGKTTILLRQVEQHAGVEKKTPIGQGQWPMGDNWKEVKRQSKRGYALHTFIYYFTPLSGQRQSDAGMIFLLIFWMGMPKLFLWKWQLQLSDRIGQHIKKSGAEAPPFFEKWIDQPYARYGSWLSNGKVCIKVETVEKPQNSQFCD